jgi:hypothetical protein
LNYSLVKRELAAAVKAAGIARLNCYGFSPAAPTIPAFTVGPVTIEPNVTFGGSDTAEFTCTVLVSQADDKDGQTLLDDLLSRDGEKSIRAALIAARGEPGDFALNGAADDLSIVRIDGYRLINWGGEEATYFGADITVRVIGS